MFDRPAKERMASMAQSITNISVAVLKVHPRNEEFFDEISGEEYERFKKSIQEDGLLSPLIVAPDMTIISGHQRLKACKELGYKSVPVIIKDDLEDEDEKLKKLIAANFGRLKNDQVKQGKLIKEYERLCGIKQGRKTENFSVSQEDIAKQLGVDARTLRNLKKLAELPQEFQDMISNGAITASTGYLVISKLSENEQLALLEKLPAAQKLTQAQVQEYIDRIKQKDREIEEIKEEMVEQQRAIKANTDSEEYARMAMAKKKAEEEAIKALNTLEVERREERERRKRAAAEHKAELEKAKSDAEAMMKAAQEQIEKANRIIAGAEKSKKPEIIEVVPDDYEEIKAELARLKANQKQNESQTPQSTDYCTSLTACIGTFICEMEGFALQKDLCSTISSDKKAALTHNLRTVIDRCAEFIDFIKENNGKEAA